jgi:hypothetical protein
LQLKSKERKQDEEPITLESSANFGGNTSSSGHARIIGSVGGNYSKIGQTHASANLSHKTNSSIDLSKAANRN